jgi:hypothetical protein
MDVVSDVADDQQHTQDSNTLHDTQDSNSEQMPNGHSEKVAVTNATAESEDTLTLEHYRYLERNSVAQNFSAVLNDPRGAVR